MFKKKLPISSRIQTLFSTPIHSFDSTLKSRQFSHLLPVFRFFLIIFPARLSRRNGAPVQFLLVDRLLRRIGCVYRISDLDTFFVHG